MMAPVSASRSDLYAFRISGTVTAGEMEAMAGTMNAAFGRQDEIDMLLVFDGYEGTECGAGLGIENLKSRMRSLAHVRRYVVAGAPQGAAAMVEAMGKVIPVEAESVATEAEAWAALDARPAA